jgi:serine phosphatase RsbU (regulator of sigma subunit)
MTVDLQAPTLTFTDADGEHRVPVDRDSISIGRSPGQDIVLPDPCVSRHHAVILREGADYSIVDQKSSYGTYVNGVRVERATLHDADLLQLGSLESSKLRFRLPRPFEELRDLSITSSGNLLSSLHGFKRVDDTLEPAAREIGQLNWLLSAARQLNAGGAIGDILTTLLELTLQLTGVERGFVFLKQGQEMKLARGVNANGEIIQEDSTVSRRAMQRATESEKKFSISDTLTDNAASAWASVMANRIRSIYCIPLRKREAENAASKLLGLLYLDSQIGPGHMTEVDHQLLDTIATEAAALLHNALLAEAEYKARQVREEMAVAAKIQSGLMSIDIPVLPYAVLQAKSTPCLEIGGDFFNAVALDDCLCAGIADVSGKGVSAAIVAATLQGIIHAQLMSGQGLPEIASQLNQFLYTRQVGKYVTLVLFKLYRDGQVEYLNCGHVQPLLLRGNKVERLEDSNLIVGLIPDVTYASGRCALQAGDRLLLVTDGVVEAENSAGEPFGDEGLDEIAPQGDIDVILDRVAVFQAPNPAQDDCTLLQVEYTGVAQEPVAERADKADKPLSARPHRGFRATSSVPRQS